MAGASRFEVEGNYRNYEIQKKNIGFTLFERNRKKYHVKGEDGEDREDEGPNSKDSPW